MNKHLSNYLYGALIIVTGIILIALQAQPINSIRYTIAICIIACAAIGIIAVVKSENRKVRFSYHMLHAGAILIYSIALLFAAFSIEQFILFSAVYFVFYSFSEITFCFWLFNLKSQVGVHFLIQRFITSFLVGIGAIVLLSYSNANENTALMGIGILLILTGINALLYKPIMRPPEVPVLLS
jgi:hypothetical protein